MNKYSQIILKQNWWLSIPILMVSSLFFTLSIGIFITSANIFPKGVSAFVQLVTYQFNLKTYWFSLILLVINIPLCIVFWKSLGKKFIIYTFLWLLFQFLWSLVIFMFKIDINPFGFQKTSDGYIIPSGRIIYSLIGAVFVSIAIGFSFLAGGSSGGVDFFIYYYYLKNQKSIGFYSMLFGFITVFICISIQYALGISVEKTIYSLMFGVTTFITIMYILVYSLVISFVYPRHKRINVQITSTRSDEIINFLVESKFHHGYSVRKERSVYSNRDITIISSVISFMEIRTFIPAIKEIDPKSWITITYVQNVYGGFNDKLFLKTK